MVHINECDPPVPNERTCSYRAAFELDEVGDPERKALCTKRAESNPEDEKPTIPRPERRGYETCSSGRT
jgi:hypothetical protein